MGRGVTTAQAAKVVDISLMTLQRWIAAGKIQAPSLEIRNGRAVRLWNRSALTQLQKAKQTVYCKGRGRKMELNP